MIIYRARIIRKNFAFSPRNIPLRKIIRKCARTVILTVLVLSVISCWIKTQSTVNEDKNFIDIQKNCVIITNALLYTFLHEKSLRLSLLCSSSKSARVAAVICFPWHSTKHGLDWTGQLDWTIGLDSWTGQLDWTVGLDYWTGILFY